MNGTSGNLNAAWGELIIEELVRNGAGLFCISPGSRSTPLVTAVAKNKRAAELSVVHFDERGAAYYAIGYARASRKPAVLICTSGTAAANYYPAVTEAYTDNVPLIVLTADRPPELHGVGANQTIDQTGLYGKHVRYFRDLPCPDPAINMEFLLTVVDQAYSEAHNGPVHINCQYRESLHEDSALKAVISAGVNRWKTSLKPFTDCPGHIKVLPEAGITAIAGELNTAGNVLLIAGTLSSPNDRQAVLSLAAHTGFTFMPDIKSGCRLGKRAGNILSYYDLALAADKDMLKAFDTVLLFGGAIVSKRLQVALTAGNFAHFLQIDSSSRWLDPGCTATRHIEADIPAFCAALQTRVHPRPASGIQELNESIGRILEKEFERTSALTEPATARLISSCIPDTHCLFLSSSMPVRDMDTFGSDSGAAVPVGHNRGVSGIDGTIASAAGFADASESHITLLIGDLAFLHDINSLALLKAMKQSMTIVVINNNGGGIFSFLPVRKEYDIFEKYFSAPHGLTFDKAAEMHDMNYYRPATTADFKKAYQESLESWRHSIIEVKTDRRENTDCHKKLINLISHPDGKNIPNDLFS